MAPDLSDRRDHSDRRQVSRGGRRPYDVPGRYPPVLIADSDDGARRPCVRYLQNLGFQVEEASTGEAALAILETINPRVAIAEATLPRDDAFQAAVRQRGIPYLVTATSEMGTLPRNSAAVLMKPFELEKLITEVRRALTRNDRAVRGVIGFD